jgi:hypothetical protein
LLVPEKDPQALCGALRDMAADPESWLRMGRDASAFITANFEQGAQIAHLEQQYTRVLDQVRRLRAGR